MEYGSVGVMEKRRLRMRPINSPFVTSGFRTVGWLSLLEFGGVWCRWSDEEKGNVVKPVERLDLLRQP